MLYCETFNRLDWIFGMDKYLMRTRGGEGKGMEPNKYLSHVNLFFYVPSIFWMELVWQKNAHEGGYFWMLTGVVGVGLY